MAMCPVLRAGSVGLELAVEISRREEPGVGLKRGVTHVVVEVAEAVPVQRWWIPDDVDDENACFVPLRPGGPLTRVYRAADVPEYDDDEWVWNGRVPGGCLTAIVGPRG